MGAGYLIDTNVVSDYFKAVLPLPAKEFVSELFDDSPRLSIVTRIELLSWVAGSAIEAAVREFLSTAKIFQIEANIVSSCVAIRRQRILKLPDAIIAATALANDFTLVTRNTTDFNSIAGLKLIDPWKL